MISKFDMYGSTIDLNLNGNTSHKSFIGGIISVIILAISVFLTKDTFMDYINQENPYVSRDKLYNTDNLDFNSDDLLLFFSFLFPKTNNKAAGTKILDGFNSLDDLENLSIDYSCDNCTESNSATLEFNYRKSTITDCKNFPTQEYSYPELTSSLNKRLQEINGQKVFCLPKNTSINLKRDDTLLKTNSLNITANYLPINNDDKNDPNYYKSCLGQVCSGSKKRLDPLLIYDKNSNVLDQIKNGEFDNNISSCTSTQDSCIKELKANSYLLNEYVFYGQMQKYMMLNFVPIILFTHQTIEINLKNASNPILKQNRVKTLNYYDTSLGIPNGYIIYIQKSIVTVDKSILLISQKEEKKYYTVKAVESDFFSVSIRGGMNLIFRIFPDTEQINIRFVSLGDVLGAFGAYFSVFTLIGESLSMLYSDLFYNSALVNSVFFFNMINDAPRNLKTKKIIFRENQQINLKNDVELYTVVPNKVKNIKTSPNEKKNSKNLNINKSINNVESFNLTEGAKSPDDINESIKSNKVNNNYIDEDKNQQTGKVRNPDVNSNALINIELQKFNACDYLTKIICCYSTSKQNLLIEKLDHIISSNMEIGYIVRHNILLNLIKHTVMNKNTLDKFYSDLTSISKNDPETSVITLGKLTDVENVS